MSFSVPSELEVFPAYAQYEHIRPATDWLVGARVQCTPDPPFLPYSIDVPGGSTRSLSASPASMQFFGFAALSEHPWYTLTVHAQSPGDFSSWFDPPVCKSTPPFDWVNAGPTLDVALSGSYLTGAGAGSPSTYAIVGSSMNFWFVQHYLVNPAPTWPTPDALGNTFGSVLFTAAQIAGVTASLSIQSGPGLNPVTNGILRVHVQPFDLTEGAPPEDESTNYQLLGWA